MMHLWSVSGSRRVRALAYVARDGCVACVMHHDVAIVRLSRALWWLVI